MNVVTIIPAKGDSKRILEKNSINFCGKLLLSWLIEQVKKGIRTISFDDHSASVGKNFLGCQKNDETNILLGIRNESFKFVIWYL